MLEVNTSTVQATPKVLLDLWGLMLTLGKIPASYISDLLVSPKGKKYNKRQGIYYGEALHAFEIAKISKIGNKNYYEISEEFILFKGEDRAFALKKIINDNSIISRIKENTKKLKDSTLKRRMKDLNKFISFDYNSYLKSIEYKNVQRDPNEESDYKKQKENTSNEKGTFQSIKDKSTKHKKMANIIIEYAKEHNIQLKQEFLNADLTSYNNKTRTLSIIEIKSYDASFLAIGQLLHYENRFKSTIYKDLKINYKKIYVTNTKLNDEKTDLLKKLNIKYVLLDHETIQQIFK